MVRYEGSPFYASLALPVFGGLAVQIQQRPSSNKCVPLGRQVRKSVDLVGYCSPIDLVFPTLSSVSISLRRSYLVLALIIHSLLLLSIHHIRAWYPRAERATRPSFNFYTRFNI